MINPIKRKNRLEHLQFLKYALELMELLSGKTINNEEEIETSLANINTITSLEFNTIVNRITSSLKLPPLKECPVPKPKNLMCTNFAARFSHNIHSRKLDRRLIHSRFCKTYDIHGINNDPNQFFTCCDFLAHDRIVMGTNYGCIKIFNLFSCLSNLTLCPFSSASLSILKLKCSNNGKLLLSSTSIKSTLYSINNNDSLEEKYTLNLKDYCNFSNYNQNKIVGTSSNKTTEIYDVETGKKIMRLIPKYANRCYENYPVFDPTDKTLLSDCVLWDATSYRQIHKFDKLNDCGFNGIFHSNGYEIVIHTEVWDMRTFRLLRTVPSLDKCQTIFSREGMYAYNCYLPKINRNNYIIQPSFKTLDPYDYSDIGTFDTEYPVYHMVCNSYDTQIAIVGYTNKPRFSVVQIYDAGRPSTII